MGVQVPVFHSFFVWFGGIMGKTGSYPIIGNFYQLCGKDSIDRRGSVLMRKFFIKAKLMENEQSRLYNVS